MITHPELLPSPADSRGRIHPLLPLLLCLCLGIWPASAATRTWTGGHASSANWNLRDNWSGSAVPANGDTLVFPSGAPRLNNTNNIPGLRLAMIQFTGVAGGYTLRGNSVTLTNGITMIEPSPNTVRLDSITLGDEQAFHIPSGGGLTLWSDINLNGHNLGLAAIGDLTMRGAISGDGNVTKSGAGQLSLSGVGDNTFSGSLTVSSGTLAMNKFETITIVPLTQESRIAVPGNLILGNGSGTVVATAQFDHQIANTGAVTIREDATLNLNGNNDTVGGIFLQGGVIHTGTGMLTLGGNVSALASPDSAVINGQVFLGGDCTFAVADGSPSIDLDVRANIGGGIAHITKIGAGTLRFGGTNSYLGMTYVNAGQLNAGNDDALGTVNGTTVVSAGAQLFLELGVDTLAEHLTLSGAGSGGTNAALRVSGTAVLANDLTLNAPATIDVPAGSSLSIDDVVHGPGPVTKIGGGTLRLEGNSANTFSGGMFMKQGLLLLSKTTGLAVPGDLTVGTTNTTATVRHTEGANLSGAVTVNAGSLYDLDGQVESIDNLTLIGGGDVQTGTGQLIVDGSISVLHGPVPNANAGTISGRLRLGSSGESHITVHPDTASELPYVHCVISAQLSGNVPLIKDGPGNLALSSANTFTGPLTVAAGRLSISDSGALGSPAGDTFVEGTSILSIGGGIHVTDERLVLNSTATNGPGGFGFDAALVVSGDSTWDGTIFLAKTATVNVISGVDLNVTGAINGLAGLTKVGSGTLIYSGASSNTYIGATIVNEGTLRLARTGASGRAIAGALIIGDGDVGASADVVEIAASDSQLNRNSAVTVNGSGLLDLQPGTLLQLIGSLSGSGAVKVDGSSLRVGYNDRSTVFSGVLAGSGDIWKFGDGTLTLDGDNTLTGATRANGGVLVINGNQTSSDIFVLGPGTLSGVGWVGDLTVMGRLKPGNPAGTLTAHSVDFEPGSVFEIDLDGEPSATSHGSIASYGQVDVTGATLDLSLGYAPVAGETFSLCWNNLIDPVSGTFAGMPEGAVFYRSQIPLQLTYTDPDGTGNDIHVTVGELGLGLESARVVSGNGNGLIDPDECNEIFVTLENQSAVPVIVTSAHLQSLDGYLIVTRGESDYGTVPVGGRRTNDTAFQVRVSDGFRCGNAARFNLVVYTLAHGRFAVPVEFASGKAGAFVTFQASGVPRPIPDGVLVAMPLEVTNDFRIARARVTVHATHSAVGQLQFRLRGPDGVTAVLLSDNHGGAGDNFGNSCNQRTIFSDSAVVSITAGVAPFVGAFRPEESLAAFANRMSAGTWQLEVLDSTAGIVGSAQCWSLELAPVECAPGGGGCASCVATTSGTLDGSSPLLTKRLIRSGPPSGCGDVIPCNGSGAPGHPPYRYATHSFTNNGPATCVAVALTVPCAAGSNGLVAAAYLGDFNPADACANLLGDSGQEISDGAGGFSFAVPAGAKFTVVVNEHNYDAPSSGCGGYSLELYGLPCPEKQPTLHIANDAGPDAVRLHWSTAYPGFDLQGRPSIGGLVIGGFTNVNASPVVIDGHYSVTNKHDGKGNGFFRLRKP